MVAVNKNLFRKIPASSILEVVIGMVIIMIAFGMAMMIFIKVSGYAVSGKTTRANAILEQQLVKLKNNPIALSNDEMSYEEEFSIHCSVKPYGNEQKVVEVELNAFDREDKLISALTEIIIKPDDAP